MYSRNGSQQKHRIHKKYTVRKMHLSKYETVHHFKEKWGKESGIKMQIVSSYDIFRTNVV